MFLKFAILWLTHHIFSKRWNTIQKECKYIHISLKFLMIPHWGMKLKGVLFSFFLIVFWYPVSVNLSNGTVKWDYINVLSQTGVTILIREGFKMMTPSSYHLLNQKQEMCILSDVRVERKLNTSRYSFLFQIKANHAVTKLLE